MLPIMQSLRKPEQKGLLCCASKVTCYCGLSSITSHREPTIISGLKKDGLGGDLNRLVYSHIRVHDGFRVLVVQPAVRRNDAVICGTMDVSLSAKPQYEALSYQWGVESRSDDTPTILLNGKVFCVRQNLLDAISHLRLQSEPRILWIDAVCINQDDENERNQQVTQMGSIYSQASQVIAWLGLSNEQTSAAIKTIASVPPWNPMLTSQWIAKEVTLNQLRQVKTSFCSMNYWERLWIIQELVLAEKVLIYCGDDQLTWPCLRVFFEHVYQHSRYGTGVHLELGALRTMCSEIRKTMPTRLCHQRSTRLCQQRSYKAKEKCDKGIKEESNMYDLCLRYAESLCEDPRDKVYGLLGFAAGCCKFAIPVDYSLSMSQVCGLVLEHYCTSHLYEERLIYPKDAEIPQSSVEVSEIPIMRICQLFHMVVGVNSADLMPRNTQLANQAESLNRDPDIRQLESKHLDTTQSDTTQSEISSLDSVYSPDSLSTNGTEKTAASAIINIASQLSNFTSLASQIRMALRLGAAPSHATSDSFSQVDKTKGRQIRVWGKFRGRITRLSPIVTDSPKSSKCKTWKEEPYVPQLGDDINAETMRSMARSNCYEMCETTRELDLVREASCTHPLTIELGIPGCANGKDPFLSTSQPSRDLESPSTAERDRHGFSEQLEQIWLLAQRNNPEKFHDYRIAIEANGLICLVPPTTRVGDLVCLFSDCDVIAILRPAGGDGEDSSSFSSSRIVGRAVAFLTHPAHTPLRDYHEKHWPKQPPLAENRIPLDLDIETLQLFTVASTTPDRHPDARW